MKKMVLTAVIWCCMGSLAIAQTTQVNYKATFGIFGKVGNITNTIIHKDKHYQIKTKVTLAGLAKLIMGGQTEEYISKGHLENGRMVSDMYQMISRKKHTVTSKDYQINHKQKRVVKRYRKWVKGKLIKDTSSTLNFYAKDDLLTLYFNMDNYVRIHHKGTIFTVKAVGLEKQKGIVKITVPSEHEETIYKKDLGEHITWYAKALIVQKNFRKKKGDILLGGGQDGFIKKAVIKDILMYGDAKLIRIK